MINPRFLELNLPEVAFAHEVILKASNLISLIQTQKVNQTLNKDDRSPVTLADFASQALVAAELTQHFPQDVLVAEEGADALRDDSSFGMLEQIAYYLKNQLPQANPEQVCTWIDKGTAEPAERFWTLDPIDGTKGFLRGDQYVVALALLVNAEVQLGVLGCPMLELPFYQQKGCMFLAVKGKGSWVAPISSPFDFVQLHVSQQRDVRFARLLRSFESGHTNVGVIELLLEKLGVKVPALRMDSQAKYAVLAAAQGELLLRLLSPHQPHYREKIWDQAAGSIILEEAGGKITDMHGKKLDFSTGRTLENNRGVFASNGWLHDEVLEALHELLSND